MSTPSVLQTTRSWGIREASCSPSTPTSSPPEPTARLAGRPSDASRLAEGASGLSAGQPRRTAPVAGRPDRQRRPEGVVSMSLSRSWSAVAARRVARRRERGVAAGTGPRPWRRGYPSAILLQGPPRSSKDIPGPGMRLQKDSRRRESRSLEKLPGGEAFQRTTPNTRISANNVLACYSSPPDQTRASSVPRSCRTSSGDQCGGDGQKEEDRA